MRLLLALLLLAAAACGPEDKCAGMTCSQGRVCQPATGVCEAADAGR